MKGAWCISQSKTLEKVKASGGKVIRGKTPIGQFGFVGHFEDTEGNRVALHQG